MKIQRSYQFAIMTAALLGALLWGAVQAPNLAATRAAETPAVTPQRLQAHVEHLAAPGMRGRGTGSKEIDRAADYIATQFREFGLEAPSKAGYFQDFTVTVGAKLGKENRLAVDGKPGSAWKAGKDYVPLNFSESGEATLQLVFAGYGISAEEHRYDDYLHLDVQDKAVIVMRHEPQENDERSVFAGRELTQYSHIVNKAINAKMHGAKAMILVNDPVPHSGEEEELVKFGSLAGPDNSGILLIHARRSVVESWLAAAGKSLAEVQKAIDASLTPQSFYVPDVKLTLKVDVTRIQARARNVGGILRGSDPTLAGEAIVVGAHYDHLGLGERNSLAPSLAGRVHPGADDNASGTAAMMEIARVMAERRSELKRSVVFLAFSAEELGLLGSNHYIKSPLWPLERTAAMINLDMVGRIRDNKLYVGGVGTSPGFKALIEEANGGNLTISYSEGGTGSSDHTSFYVKNIPVIFFFSGLHSDYHKPSDTPDRIHSEDHARVTGLALRAAQSLASRPERPQFVRVAEPARPVSGAGGSGYGAYFGSIPDMGEELKGVKFSDVREGSPAAKAGLKAGDVLVEFAGKPINNLYDFTFALRAHKPGETVKVVVVRAGQRLEVDVTLTRRQ